MDTTPKISVIMAVYNGEKYLAETIESILKQSFTDFEFIIVNDASTDATGSILDKSSSDDLRIKIITNKVNRERSFSRNLAIANTRSNLIAVIDADDWAHPARLEKQFNFMQEHPEVDVCGSALSVYSTGETWLPPSENQYIRSELLFNSCIYHPTVMFKKDKILTYCQGYTVGTTAEDYDLWARLSLHSDVIFANISEPLLRYRIYPIESRANYYDKQKNSANMTRLRLIQNLFPSTSQENFDTHLILAGVETPRCTEKLHTCGKWVKILLTANTQAHVYNHEILHEVVSQHWLSVCQEASKHNIMACYAYYITNIYTNGTSVFFKCLIMMVHSFAAKILPLNTRRRTFVKHIFAKYKSIF